MVEDLAADAGQEALSIFDFDIPCPRCEYNLRGLTVPRCPECGDAFDPPHLLAEYHNQRQPVPSFRWVGRNILRHPIVFWAMPEVRYVEGPPLRQDFCVSLLAVTVLFGVGICMSWSRNMSPPAYALDLLVASLPAALVLTGFLALQGTLCWLGLLLLSHHPRKWQKADAIVGYSWWWVIPTIVLLAVIAETRSTAQPVLGPAAPHWGHWVLGAALLTSCLCWTAALTAGALRVTGGSWLVAAWCILFSPVACFITLMPQLW